MILKPYLHLGRRKPDDGGEVLAFGRAQVPLLTKAPLKLEGLCLGEQYSSLALFMLGLVRLRLVALLLVLEILRFLVLGLVAVLLLRRERQVRDCRARRVRLLKN